MDIVTDHRHEGPVLFVEEPCQVLSIPVTTPDELRQIIGADGEPVEPPGEVLGLYTDDSYLSLVRQAVSLFPPTERDRQQQDTSSQRDGI